MAEAAGLILSAIGAGLSLTSILQSNLGDNDHDDTHTTVVLTCADVKPADSADSVSGSVDVRLFTRYGEEAGAPVVDQYVNGGNTHYQIKYGLSSEYHGNQTPYMKITGNDDAICIPWLTMTWPDGTSWAWNGQNGRNCGKTPWHYNDATFGVGKNDDGSDGQRIRPDCSWIDGNGDVGGDTTAFSIYFPYQKSENDATYGGNNGDSGHVCNGPSFTTYTNDDGGGLSFYSPPPDINNSGTTTSTKRGLPEIVNTSNATEIVSKRLFTKNNTKLIQSSREQHSAVELCEADMSWGASLVNTYENKFCDMSTKTVYDVCTPELLAAGLVACFDMDTLGLAGFRTASAYDWKSFVKWGDEVDAASLETTRL